MCLQLHIEGAAGNPQQGGRRLHLEAHFLHHPEDVPPLHFKQGHARGPGQGRFGGAYRHRGFPPGAGAQAQVPHIDDMALAGQDGPLQGVLQLADVAGPGLLPEPGLGLGGELEAADAPLVGDAGQEEPGQQGDVLSALPQGRDGDLQGADAVMLYAYLCLQCCNLSLHGGDCRCLRCDGCVEFLDGFDQNRHKNRFV